MARGMCSPEQVERCPLPSHYSDRDHIVPQRYKRFSWLLRHYIVTPENKQQVCRWEHIQKTDSPAEELENCIPTEDFMITAIRRAHEAGQPKLNHQDLLRLERYEERLSDAA